MRECCHVVKEKSLNEGKKTMFALTDQAKKKEFFENSEGLACEFCSITIHRSHRLRCLEQETLVNILSLSHFFLVTLSQMTLSA